jgi:hypothetical protein
MTWYHNKIYRFRFSLVINSSSIEDIDEIGDKCLKRFMLQPWIDGVFCIYISTVFYALFAKSKIHSSSLFSIHKNYAHLYSISLNIIYIFIFDIEESR